MKRYIKSIVNLETLGILSLSMLFYFISKYNYLLFHSLIEIFGVIISISIMFIALGTIKISDSNYFSSLGIFYGFLGIINLFHVFTYKGIILFTSGSNIPTQLWVAGRYYESIMLLFCFYYIKNKPNYKKFVAINFVTVFIILMSILVIKIFPACYIEGQGLTKFKIYSEYIISLIFLASIYKLNSFKELQKYKENRLFIKAIVFKIFADLCFTLYLGVYDFPNFLGHIFHFISFYLIFKALFFSVIIKPYSFLFRQLNLEAEELEKKNQELVMTKNLLEKENVKKQRLIELLPEGLIVTEKGKIILINNSLCSMFGIEDKNMLLKHNIHDTFYCSSEKQLTDKLDTNAPVECTLCLGDKCLDVEVSSLPMTNEGEYDYQISIVRDISYRKKISEMEFIIKQKQKEETFKNEFFANISHELRTPINVIYSAIQLENLYLENKDIDSVIRYNGTIKQNCLRLIRITNNIIDTTKIQAGFLMPKLRIQNIVNIIENITLSITTYYDYKNINVVFDTEEEEIYVNCDEDLMERIMLNLLSNSVKYGKQGGSIDVNIHKTDDYSVQICVKDDGIGIPEKLRDSVFNRFAKGDTSISRDTEGSGIGLYLVKSFVEMQNGSISLKSEFNKGTEFLLTFPIAAAADEISACSVEDDMIPKCNIVEKIEIEFSDIYK